jgi:hypothetical protein
MKEGKYIGKEKKRKGQKERKKSVFQGIGCLDLRTYPFFGITYLSIPQPLP